MAKRTSGRKHSTPAAPTPLGNKRRRRKLDALPDTLDFRDHMFEATLVEVPPQISLSEYRKLRVPILDQGQEGACTGFGLATVANYLLLKRRVMPDQEQVSPRMLYEMAKRYDEWVGENYEGSSARGAMKGWYKHGACSWEVWPYKSKRSKGDILTNERATDARRRPLGAYFRVNHRDLVAMHSAISEVGVLYATASVHEGWDEVKGDGKIRFSDKNLGGHAFAIVAYDADGLWIQNSWGEDWGNKGCGQISYDDWLQNGTDVWVARLGAPVKLTTAASAATGFADAAQASRTYVFCDLRPHIVSIGNDGQFRTGGTYGTSAEDVRSIIRNDIPRLTQNWPVKRILLYAHGGLVSEDAAVQRVADYRTALMDAQVYPLAFIWKTDYWTTLKNVLADAVRRRRPEGFLDNAKDFMLDRLDDALEPIARALTGKLEWDEMKENAALASSSQTGGARIVAEEIIALAKKPKFELHVVGHSAGAIFHGGLLPLLTKQVSIKSCTLWAPACTVDLFRKAYLPSIKNGKIESFNLFTLTDKAEQEDDCGDIYHKSLLYLVSNAFEERPRIPLFRDGFPILGMEKFVYQELQNEISMDSFRWIKSPNDAPDGSRDASRARSHGSFDDDASTVKATLARILSPQEPVGAERPAVAEQVAAAKIRFHRTAGSQRDRRSVLQAV
jgi:hypothetical protein